MIVLASASPRRKELLAAAGVPFTIHAADLDESVQPGESPVAYVMRLAAEKATAVWDALGRPDAATTVVGADTTVVVDGAILGKPADAAEAHAMLQALSGRWHEVVTGFCVRRGHDLRVDHTATAVEMMAITMADRAAYVASGEWAGKAGGYAIQGLAGALVRQIRGSYSNVVGLPVCEVVEALRTVGALPAEWTLGGAR